MTHHIDEYIQHLFVEHRFTEAKVGMLITKNASNTRTGQELFEAGFIVYDISVNGYVATQAFVEYVMLRKL